MLVVRNLLTRNQKEKPWPPSQSLQELKLRWQWRWGILHRRGLNSCWQWFQDKGLDWDTPSKFFCSVTENRILQCGFVAHQWSWRLMEVKRKTKKNKKLERKEWEHRIRKARRPKKKGRASLSAVETQWEYQWEKKTQEQTRTLKKQETEEDRCLEDQKIW